MSNDAHGRPELGDRAHLPATAAAAPSEPSRRALPLLAALAIGTAAAVVGLLPWLVTGMRLPLQNLWAADTAPEDMPLVLLPYSQYAVALLAALLLTGAAVAGLAGRILRPRLPRSGLVAIAAGVVLVQVAAAVQTSITVGNGLEESTPARLYLLALDLGAGASIALGLLLLLLTARAPKPGAVIGFTIAALAFGTWLGSLIVPFGSVLVTMPALLDLTRWVPPVLVGVALAWSGFRTLGRIVAAAASLALLWVGPALVTAITSAAGSRVLLPYPREMLDYGLGVLRMAATMPELVLPRIVVALVVAVAGVLILRAVRPSAIGTRAGADVTPDR